MVTRRPVPHDERVLPLGERELSKDTDKKDESHDFVSFTRRRLEAALAVTGLAARGPCYRCSRSCGRYQRQPRRTADGLQLPDPRQRK